MSNIPIRYRVEIPAQHQASVRRRGSITATSRLTAGASSRPTVLRATASSDQHQCLSFDRSLILEAFIDFGCVWSALAICDYSCIGFGSALARRLRHCEHAGWGNRSWRIARFRFSWFCEQRRLLLDAGDRISTCVHSLGHLRRIKLPSGL